MRIFAPLSWAAAACVLGAAASAPAQQGGAMPSYLAVPAPVGQYGLSGPQAPSVGYPLTQSYTAPAGYYDPTQAKAPAAHIENQYDEALSSECCEACAECCEPARPLWFGSVYGLVMTRNNPNRTWFSANAANFDDQLLNGQDVSDDWNGGGGVTFGRAFCGSGCGGCGGAGIQASYWMLDPLEDEAVLTGGFYNTPIFMSLNPLGVGFADAYFDGSPEHHLARRNEVHNIELNILEYPVFDNNRTFNVSWLAGVRFFKFDDDLLFSAVRNGFTYGDPQNTAFYDVDVENNLIGAQLGAYANLWLTERISLFATPKFGIYNNYMTQDQSLYLLQANGAPGFDIGTKKNDVSFLAEIDVGVNYRFSRCVTAFVGYRAVAVTGVALADDQVPQFLNDVPEIERIESNGSLVLHGATAGLWFNY
jgi:Putative beta barrel porin-7 (BBP7)